MPETFDAQIDGLPGVATTASTQFLGWVISVRLVTASNREVWPATTDALAVGG